MLNELDASEKKSGPYKIVVVGHVDDGKSTLIGRLLYETDSFPEGKLQELETISLKRNMPMEWSFVLDAFQAERDQAITIDTSQVYIKLESCNVTIIDAPGHLQFLKNMISGAADANAAILLLDVTQGVREQTRRHAYLLKFLGIQQIAVLINKMDLIDFSKSHFEQVSSAVSGYLKDLGIEAKAIIPISARHGDMLVTASENMKWYDGPTVLEVINCFYRYDISNAVSLRFPVQDVYKFDDFRAIVGRIESGSLRVGDELLFSPSNQTAKVQSIEGWNAVSRSHASAGDSIGIVLDKQLFVERGDVISHLEDPPILTKIFRATLFWVGNKPLKQDSIYKIKLTTCETFATVQSIEFEVNTDTLQKNKTISLSKNQSGEVILCTSDLLPIDEYEYLRRTGRFVLIDDSEIVAGGMISMKGCENQRNYLINKPLNLTKIEHYVTTIDREKRSGHKGAILWFTGISGAGKSTLAMAIEHLLFLKGCQVYTLDGDNMRSGLSMDLGFSPKDRTENIRRVGEVAALFAGAGFICIAAFISPYAADRNKIRKIVPPNVFHEIYIQADLATCEQRDPKGLYKKARAGEISEFTGISSPYEIPTAPDLIVDTVSLDVEQCINKIMDYVQENFFLNADKTIVNEYLSCPF